MNNILKTEDAVAYLRVSSSKQMQQGESIEDQKNTTFNIAKTRNLRIVPNDLPFIESYSGRKNNRPVYEELKKYIKENPNVKYCLIRGIDRFTRGGAVNYGTMKNELEGMGVWLIDSYGIIQPNQNTLAHLGVEFPWSMYSPSKASELMEAHRGEREVTDILTRMIGAEVVLTREGYHIGAPKEGFVNAKIFVDGKKKNIQIQDSNTSHFFIKMFEMRATGGFTDQEIVDKINTIGYKSKVRNKWSQNKSGIVGTTGGLKLTVKHFQNIISNPIYCGVSNHKWLLGKPIKVKYSGLISISIFNKANRGKLFIEENSDGSIKIHKDYNPHNLKRLKDNPLFPFKSIIMCPECGKPFLGSSSKGKSGKSFPAYHCARGHKQYGVSKEEFEKSLSYFINNLKYKEGFLKSFETTLINKYREKEKELGEFSVKAGNNVSDLEAQKLQKIEAFTSTQNVTIRATLENQIEDLQIQITEAQKHRNMSEIKENDIHAFIKYAKYLMEHPEEMLLKQKDLTLLKSLFGLVFDELPTYTQIVNGTPKLSLPYMLSEEFYTNKSFVAGDEGIEPSPTVLETVVLPLN